jgi:PAS domain S-box-containing protein
MDNEPVLHPHHEALTVASSSIHDLTDLFQREKAARVAAERRAERLARLQLVTDKLSQTVHLQQAAEVVVREGIAALGARCGILALLDEDGLNVNMAYYQGYSDGFVHTWKQYSLETALPSCDTIRTGEAIWLHSPDEHQDRYPILSLYDEMTAAVCALPIVLAGETRASLVFGFSSPQEFDAETRAFVTSLALQGALAMERAYLFDAAQQEIRERTRAQEAQAELVRQLESQKQRTDAILATVPGVVWESWNQPDEALLQVDYVSEYAETLLGYSVEEWRSKPDFSLSIMHPDDREAVLDAAMSAFAEGTDYKVRFRWITKDGRVLWMAASAVVVRDESGKPVGMRGVTVDVTERKREEDARAFRDRAGELLASSLDYEATLKQVVRLAVPDVADWCAVDLLADDGSIDLLAVGHVDPAKVEWARTLRSTRPVDMDAPTGLPNVLRTGQAEIYPEISDEMLVAAAKDEEMLELLRSIGFHSVMIVPMRTRGRTLGAITFVVSDKDSLRYNDDYLRLAQGLADRAAMAIENARLYRAAQQEIAERAETEAELRRSRNELAVILEGITDGLTAQDRTGRVVYANSAAARFSGYASVEEFVAVPFGERISRFEMFDEAGNPLEWTSLPGRRALSGEDAPRTTLRFRSRANGEERWAEIRATPVRDAGGEVVLAINFFSDVTARMLAEQERERHLAEIEALNDRLRRAMTETHHRVKNNLQIMAAMVDMQGMEDGDTVPVRELLRLGSHIRTLAIIHELLTERARADGRAEDIPARKMLEQLLSRLDSASGGRAITYQLDDISLPSRQSTSLALVTNELVSNAIKHGREHVAVKFIVEQGRARLVVCDDGPGFPDGFDAAQAANTGLELVENLTRWDLSGATTYSNQPDGGGCVDVAFPTPELPA